MCFLVSTSCKVPLRSECAAPHTGMFASYLHHICVKSKSARTVHCAASLKLHVQQLCECMYSKGAHKDRQTACITHEQETLTGLKATFAVHPVQPGGEAGAGRVGKTWDTALARDSSRPSAPGGPENCIPTGRPSVENCPVGKARTADQQMCQMRAVMLRGGAAAVPVRLM